MESRTLGLIEIIILVNFLVCRKTRRGNCLLVPYTNYATVHAIFLPVGVKAISLSEVFLATSEDFVN